MNETAHPIEKWADEDVAGYYHPELDLGYIASAAFDVARGLSKRRPVEVAYQPGDFTFYGLVFVPLAGIETATPRKVEGVEWEGNAVRGVLSRNGENGYRYEDDAVLISWIEGATYGIRLLSGGLSASFVAEKWKTTIVSGGSLVLLFRAVSWYLDRAHLLVGART